MLAALAHTHTSKNEAELQWLLESREPAGNAGRQS